MKKWRTIAGGIILTVGLLQVGRTFYSGYLQSDYGKGYLIGSALLIIIGIALIIAGRKRR
jgi:hypothetical protein